MGDYTFFIVGSYAITALVVGGLVLRAVLDHRAQVRALAELESRGMRRRSSARSAAAEPLAAGQAAR
jgi:heme exporter protein D